MFQSVVKEFSLQSHRFVHAFSMQVRHQQRDGNLAIIQAFVRSYWQNHKHWLVSLMGWVFCAYPLLIYEFEPCLLGFDIVSGE
jgi:hypothetical protein